MNLLPKWVIPSVTPAVHDFESATVLEQTAKVYAALNTLITEYNQFADTVNGELDKFTENELKAREDFECKIIKIYRDFQFRTDQKTISEGGLSLEQKTLLIEILEDALFDANISVKVAQLRASFGV